MFLLQLCEEVNMGGNLVRSVRSRRDSENDGLACSENRGYKVYRNSMQLGVDKNNKAF